VLRRIMWKVFGQDNGMLQEIVIHPL
jgi:hypothetical protein